MLRTMTRYVWSFAVLVLLFSACGKEGPGGKASIKGYVKHHADPIANAVVYIKYGTQESAGTDVTYYDASVNADANAYFEFTGLKKGDYYLFSVGFDPSINETVSGGIPVKINSKSEEVAADVPVTEP